MLARFSTTPHRSPRGQTMFWTLQKSEARLVLVHLSATMALFGVMLMLTGLCWIAGVFLAIAVGLLPGFMVFLLVVGLACIIASVVLVMTFWYVRIECGETGSPCLANNTCSSPTIVTLDRTQHLVQVCRTYACIPFVRIVRVLDENCWAELAWDGRRHRWSNLTLHVKDAELIKLSNSSPIHFDKLIAANSINTWLGNGRDSKVEPVANWTNLWTPLAPLIGGGSLIGTAIFLFLVLDLPPHDPVSYLVGTLLVIGVIVCCFGVASLLVFLMFMCVESNYKNNRAKLEASTLHQEQGQDRQQQQQQPQSSDMEGGVARNVGLFAASATAYEGGKNAAAGVFQSSVNNSSHSAMEADYIPSPWEASSTRGTAVPAYGPSDPSALAQPVYYEQHAIPSYGYVSSHQNEKH